MEGRGVSLHVLHRSPEGVQNHCPHPPVTGTHSHRSTTADDSSHPTIPRWNACVRPDDGVCSEWFEVEQGLRQGYVLSPLLTCLTIGGGGGDVTILSPFWEETARK